MSVKKMGNTLTLMHDKVTYFFAWISALLLFCITVAVCVEVIIRKFWNSSLVGVIECSEHALVFITFLSASWILKNEAHVKVDVVGGLLKPRARATLNVITSYFGALLCLYFSYRSALTIWSLWQRGINSVKLLEIPLAPLYASVFLGFFLLTFQFFRRAHFYLEKKKTLQDTD